MSAPVLATIALLALLGGCRQEPTFEDPADPRTNAALDRAAANISERDGREDPALQRRRDRIGGAIRRSSTHAERPLPQ